MSYSEIHTWLTENNKTHEDMDAIWEYMRFKNSIVARFHSSGLKWYDLNDLCRKDLLVRYSVELVKDKHMTELIEKTIAPTKRVFQVYEGRRDKKC